MNFPIFFGFQLKFFRFRDFRKRLAWNLASIEQCASRWRTFNIYVIFVIAVEPTFFSCCFCGRSLTASANITSCVQEVLKCSCWKHFYFNRHCRVETINMFYVAIRGLMKRVIANSMMYVMTCRSKSFYTIRVFLNTFYRFIDVLNRLYRYVTLFILFDWFILNL